MKKAPWKTFVLHHMHVCVSSFTNVWNACVDNWRVENVDVSCQGGEIILRWWHRVVSPAASFTAGDGGRTLAANQRRRCLIRNVQKECYFILITSISAPAFWSSILSAFIFPAKWTSLLRSVGQRGLSQHFSRCLRSKVSLCTRPSHSQGLFN